MVVSVDVRHELLGHKGPIVEKEASLVLGCLLVITLRVMEVNVLHMETDIAVVTPEFGSFVLECTRGVCGRDVVVLQEAGYAQP
jgi:hypothetical protein